MDAFDLLRADQPNPPQVRRPLTRVVDEALDGDPFVKVVEVNGQRYRMDEGALVELEERNAREFEVGIRMGWFGARPPQGISSSS